MIHPLASKTGSAFAWKTVQFGGTKFIFLLRTLIVARLLSPADFGLLAIGMTALEVLLCVSDLGIMPALIQREKLEDKHFHTAWTLGLLRALGISALVIVTAPWIARLFAEPGAVNVIRVLALRPLLNALMSIKVANLHRQLQFRSLAIINLSAVSVNAVVAISLAIYWGVWALVAGTLAGALTTGIVSYLLAPYRPRFFLDRSGARSIIAYGRWILLISLLGVGGGTLLKVVISRQLGALELGIYYLAAQLAFLPGEISAEVFGSVSFPLYARLQANRPKASRAYKAIFAGMFTLLVPLSVLLIVLAPSLVEHLLGPRWQGSEPIIRILACVGIVGLLGETVVPVLKGVGQPYKVVILEALQLGIITALAWELAGRFGLIGAALAWIPAIGLSQFVSVFFVRKVLPRPFEGLSPVVGAILLTSGSGAWVAWETVRWMPGMSGLVLAGFLALLAMAALLGFIEKRFHLGLLNQLILAFPQADPLIQRFLRRFF